jgi:chromosome segregation ATPase
MDNENAPATKADIAGLDQKLNDKIDTVKTELDEKIDMLRSELHHSFDELSERLRDGQTELLKAFYGFAQSNRERLGSTDNETASLKTRLAILESRLEEVERRLNLPPAA